MSAALMPVELVPVGRQERAVVVVPLDFHAAFADFLCIDVANGDASPDTVRSYRSEVALWAAWCASQNLNPATVTPTHIKRYRQALLDAGYKPITIQVKRLRNLLMLSMMALQALRTIEVHRANVEDLTERGEILTLLVRGKTRDRIAYPRPDTADRLKTYLALRGKIERDGAGTPLFAAVGNHRGGKRLSRHHIRVQTDKYLRLAGLKRPGISNHALRHYAGTLGYLHRSDLRAVQDFLGHADPRMTAKYAHVVDMAKKNPALFIPVKLGGKGAPLETAPPKRVQGVKRNGTSGN